MPPGEAALTSPSSCPSRRLVKLPKTKKRVETIGKPSENHRKTIGLIGQWWFDGILWDLPPGND